MDYLSLYRKWRPRCFDEGFVGQEHVVRTLKNALAMNKVAHAYLFNGPRGTGKTTAAKILAKAVNCTGRGEDPNPCNACPSCERINTGVSMDVLEIDGASNRGIDEVRELREKVKFAPVEGEYKVYIIDEVHMLTGEAFNALLKTLEEPPPHVIFIFATTESHKLPATIRSRCQCFDFKRLTPGEIFNHLAYLAREEGVKAEDAALRLIAQEAGGGLRDAIGLLEQSMAHAEGALTVSDVQAILGLVETEALFDLAGAVAERNINSGLEVIRRVLEGGKDLVVFTRQTAGFFRDLLVINLVGETAPVNFDQEGMKKAVELSGRIGSGVLKKGVDFFLEAGITVKRGTEGALPLEMALIRLVTEAEGSPGLSMDLEKRITALEELVNELKNSATPPYVPHRNAGRDPERRVADNNENNKEETGDKKIAAPSQTPDFNMKWDDLLAAVRRRKRTVEALLREGKPGGFRGGRFTIEFSPEFRFHCENIKRPENSRLVEEALLELTGKNIKLECVLGESSRESGGEQPEILRRALEIFGGEVIEMKEEE